MKKTSFVIAIVTSALLAGACGKKKDAAAPTTPAATGSASGDMGSGAMGGSGAGDMGSGGAMGGSGAGSAQ